MFDLEDAKKREVTVWAAMHECGYTAIREHESQAKALVDEWRSQDRDAGYAPVTIKLTR